MNLYLIEGKEKAYIVADSLQKAVQLYGEQLSTPENPEIKSVNQLAAQAYSKGMGEVDSLFIQYNR